MTNEEIKAQLEGLGCTKVELRDFDGSLTIPDGKICLAMQVFDDNFDDFTFEIEEFSTIDRTVCAWVEWE